VLTRLLQCVLDVCLKLGLGALSWDVKTLQGFSSCIVEEKLRATGSGLLAVPAAAACFVCPCLCYSSINSSIRCAVNSNNNQSL
jgi:hypothetical protein